MSLVDYKAKYFDLKTKYHETVDLAWRLGFEQGLQQAQLDQLTQQQQVDQMSMSGNSTQQLEQHNQESESDVAKEPTQIESQNPNNDELDQHIEKLESMLGKSEISSLDLNELKKTLADIRSLQVQINLTKSMESIKNIKMGSLNKSISFSPKVQSNLPEPAKKALSLQEKIVNDIFSKWEKDEKNVSNEITNILNIEGVTKKD